MTPIERTTWTFRTMVGLLGGSIATTWGIALFLWQSEQADRKADDKRYEAIQDSDEAIRVEMSRLATAVAIQAVESKASQDRIFDRIAGIEGEQSDVRSELREVRADIRALNGVKRDGEK